MPGRGTEKHNYELGLRDGMFYPHGLGVISVGAPLAFLKATAAKVASDAAPNVAPLSPNDGAVIQAVSGSTIIDLVTVIPFWTGATQAVTFTAWQFDATDAAGQQWRPVASGTFNPAAPLAVALPTNGRPTYVQLTSGGDAGHPVELHFDVA